MLPLEMELWRVYMVLKDLKGIETFNGRESGIQGSFLLHLLFSYHNTFDSLYLKLLQNVFSKPSTLKRMEMGFDCFYFFVFIFKEVLW